MREEDQIIDEVNHLLDKLKNLEERMKALQATLDRQEKDLQVAKEIMEKHLGGRTAFAPPPRPEPLGSIQLDMPSYGCGRNYRQGNPCPGCRSCN